MHSQNLSNLTVHFDGGQNPYWTAVRSLTHFPLLENQVEDVVVVIMQKVGRNNIAMKGLMDGRGAEAIIAVQ